MARHEVVQFTALTRHASTGFHEIKVTGLEHEVRQLAEEGHEGILPTHGQHGMKTVRRGRGAEVLGCLVNVDTGLAHVVHLKPPSGSPSSIPARPSGRCQVEDGPGLFGGPARGLELHQDGPLNAACTQFVNHPRHSGRSVR